MISGNALKIARISLFALMCMSFATAGSVLSYAQDSAETEAPVAQEGAFVKQDAVDLDKRMGLAMEMHKIKPARTQVEAVIDRIASQLPEDKKVPFQQRMMTEFEFDKLEAVSTKAMAEVFTATELEKMIDYFGSEEARTIADKMIIYQELIQPEITRMVDKAMMVVRTGGEGVKDGQKN